jgi:hypothetical protein
MALIDRILLRGPEEAARAEAARELKRAMPKSGRFQELERSGITGYYDKRFGQFDPTLDRWEEGHASALKANPLLRRIDIVADSLFHSGRYERCGLGPVYRGGRLGEYEGTIATIRMEDGPAYTTAMLTLDVGGEVRFSKLRIGTREGTDYIIRLSPLDGGMIIAPNRPGRGDLPEAIHERAADGSEVFRTLSETIAGLEILLYGPRFAAARRNLPDCE